MKHLPQLSRRQSLYTMASFAAAGALSTQLPATRAHAQDQLRIRDDDIFQFALNLEYLETEYYLRAVTGAGLSEAAAGPDASRVVGGRRSRSRPRRSGNLPKNLQKMSWLTSASIVTS
jgi:hypothetical protein